MIDNRDEYPGEPKTAELWLAKVAHDMRDWNEAWLAKWGIKQTWSMYLINKERAVHPCELAASYEAVFLDFAYEPLDPESFFSNDLLVEKFEDEFRNVAAGAPNCDYYHISGFPESAFVEHCETFRHENEEQYDEKIEEWIEYYAGNPAW